MTTSVSGDGSGGGRKGCGEFEGCLSLILLIVLICVLTRGCGGCSVPEPSQLTPGGGGGAPAAPAPFQGVGKE